MKHSEVFCQSVVQFTLPTTVSGTDVAGVCHTMPPTLTTFPHAPGGQMAPHHLPQTAIWRGVVKVVDEAEEILASSWSIVPAPLPLQLLLQTGPEHLTSCELECEKDRHFA